MSDQHGLERGFRFEGLLVEPSTGEVTGSAGTEKLDPKVMDVLVLMAAHAGEVVSRELLLERIWPGAIVTDDALTRCFYELRRQLSRAGGDERYRGLIETLPKRGYRLRGEVQPADAPGPSSTPAAPSRRRWAWAGAAAAAIAVLVAAALFLRAPRHEAGAPRSIAVLPFADMSEGQDQQYLADGIAEEILDRLAQAPNRLRVIARTSSFAFRGQAVDIPRIAKMLDVSHVLEGSVRRSGDRVRITVQLVRGGDGAHVWSTTYDRRLGELFAVQDDIAAAIAGELRVALGAAHASRPVEVSAESQEEYLHARFLFERRAEGDVERAVRHLESAVARDPGFAQAWSLLSGAYSLMWWELGYDADTWRPRQGEAARKAVETGPQLAAAHRRLGQYYLETSNLEAGMEEFTITSRLEPGNVWYSTFARGVVPWNEPPLEQRIGLVREQVEDDPLSTIRWTNLGIYLFAIGELDEAQAAFARAIELNPHPNQGEELELARLQVARREYDTAYELLAGLPAELRDYALSLLHGDPARRAEADAALARLQQGGPPGDFMHYIRVAEALALRGASDEAFATLRAGRDSLVRDESILTRLWFYKNEIDLSPFLREALGSDPRWDEIRAMPAGDSAAEIIAGLWPE